jgi:hypothetical protein
MIKDLDAIRKVVNAMTYRQFLEVKKRYARALTTADREGGDSSSSSLKYWIGWLDTMDKEEFAVEMSHIDEEEYMNYILHG